MYYVDAICKEVQVVRTPGSYRVQGDEKKVELQWIANEMKAGNPLNTISDTVQG
jgi:hypothetical protein